MRASFIPGYLFAAALFVLFLFPLITFSQIPIKTVVSAIDSFNNRMPAEKAFLQIDKPYYNSGDTIWIKAYVLDATFNYTKQSGLLYTELIDDTGKVVRRQCMPVKLGISFGQMVLDGETIREGRYTLRAYTNWMQNQGEQSFFTRPIYISKAVDNAWLIKADNKIVKKTAGDNVEMALQITGHKGNPVRLREVRVKVSAGSKALSKDNMQTDIDGKLKFNFDLPGKTETKKLIITVEDLRKGERSRKLIVPVTMNRPENIDLQFMPEGGQLVAGLPSRVGFKAIGEDGKGLTISGNIIDGKGKIIVPFKSAYLGMGSFELTPQINEAYTAQITLPGGDIKVYPLPFVKTSGINLHIANLTASDSLSMTLNATQGIIGSNNNYYLIAQSGGRVCYAAKLSFADGAIHGRISKQRFLSGITRFTLFTEDEKPVTERLVFIDHHDNLNINLKPDQQSYQPKDSIALQLNVTDRDNKPVQGSFSLAITDDSQVKADSTNVSDIQSYMLLTGDLKGEIEQPGSYFDNKNAERNITLDNLMLTQGWIGYDWKDVFNTQYQPKFNPEPEIEVKGHITRTGGKAVGHLPIMLLSTKKPVLMMDTISDANGKFVFRNFPHIDTASFILQVKDKKGKMFEANVNVEEFTPASVGLSNLVSLKPWYVDSDSTMLNSINQKRAYDKELDKFKYPEGIHRLKEVKVNGLKSIKGSHNLNGPGNADQILDDKDLLKQKKITLREMLMNGLVKGFSFGFVRNSTNLIPKIYEKRLVIIVDGTPPEFNTSNVFDEFTAEDIKGIEVSYSESYNSKYTLEYTPELMASPRSGWPAFLEITTWSGNGAFMKRVHGRYLYRPLPISWPKQFYRPKYTDNSNNTLADLRSTIHWEPNIITDNKGTAEVSFYATGKPGIYTLILQGADLNGNIGYQRKKIIIK